MFNNSSISNTILASGLGDTQGTAITTIRGSEWSRLALAPIAIIMFTAATTLCDDNTQYNFPEKKFDNAVSFPLSQITQARQKISRREALAIVDEIFKRAEDARKELVGFEANIGLQWEDDGDI